jgi:hypothetical protein
VRVYKPQESGSQPYLLSKTSYQLTETSEKNSVISVSKKIKQKNNN